MTDTPEKNDTPQAPRPEDATTPTAAASDGETGQASPPTNNGSAPPPPEEPTVPAVSGPPASPPALATEAAAGMKEAPLMEHLIELRSRLVRCLIAVGIGFAGCYAFAEQLLFLLLKPLKDVLPNGRTLIATSLPESFFTVMPKAFFIDTSRCTACRGCQVACKEWHEHPPVPTLQRGTHQNPPDFTPFNFKIVRFSEHKIDGKIKWLFFPDQCRHCLVPPCKDAADAYVPGAIVRDEATGAVLYTEKCKQLTIDQAQQVRDVCPYNIPRRVEATGMLAGVLYCLLRRVVSARPCLPKNLVPRKETPCAPSN